MSVVPRHVWIPITRISTLVGMSDQLVHFSVLFLTSGEMSVVPTCVWDPQHMDLHPGRNVYLTSWFILSVLIFDRW